MLDGGLYGEPRRRQRPTKVNEAADTYHCRLRTKRVLSQQSAQLPPCANLQTLQLAFFDATVSVSTFYQDFFLPDPSSSLR